MFKDFFAGRNKYRIREERDQFGKTVYYPETGNWLFPFIWDECDVDKYIPVRGNDVGIMLSETISFSTKKQAEEYIVKAKKQGTKIHNV